MLDSDSEQKGKNKKDELQIPKKEDRQNMLRNFLNKDIQSIEMLVRHFNTEGFKTSKPTLYRDLHELGASKKGNIWRIEDAEEKRMIKHSKFVRTHVISHFNQPYVVAVKTTIGYGRGVAFSLRKLLDKDIIGTIADDQMILLICTNEKVRDTVCEKLEHYHAANK